jgi:glutaredoxin
VENRVSKYVILSRPGCPYCDKAAEILTLMQQDFQKFDVWENPVLRDFLKAQGLNTVPQIFKDGERIGGYEELSQVFSEELKFFDKS